MGQNSITKRWVRGSLLIILLVLVVFEVAFIFYMRTTYYSGARMAIMSRINTISGQLSATADDSDTERGLMLRRMVEEFSEKSRFEFMLLGRHGDIVATSSGVVPQYADGLSDFSKALANADGVGEYVGSVGMGENIMSLCWLIPNPAGGITAVRLVTSLAGVDGQMNLMIAVSLGVVLLIVFFSVLSGTYFIRSIVLPLGRVEQTATRIAAGDFAARIEPPSGDEIGRLCETINNMAGELGKTEQMKNEFISSVSHELRTPLTSIKGWTETLAVMDDPANENYQKGLAIIVSETDRLYNMVEELLDFSRLQNGGVQLQTERLDLVAEVADVLLMVGQRAKLEGVTLDFNEPELPCPVMADRNRLRQIFLNILDNALKYSPAGSTIWVTLTAEAGMATVRVTDEGPGIRPDDLASVKQKFFKGQGAVRGSGIGLAVVDDLITMHGGSFDMESKWGKGTSAIVRLPMKPFETERKSND